MHLSDDQLYELAVKIAANAAFSEKDVANMKHIAECDDCYHLLCCIIAMRDVSLHLGEFAISPAAAQATASVPEKVTAVIHLAINKIRPFLDQVESGISSWTFDAPLAIAGVRSGTPLSHILKLEDKENAKTFLAYDPEKKLLVIQISDEGSQDMPSAELRLPNGETVTVPLNRKGSALWGEVHELADGDYQVLLSK